MSLVLHTVNCEMYMLHIQPFSQNILLHITVCGVWYVVYWQIFNFSSDLVFFQSPPLQTVFIYFFPLRDQTVLVSEELLKEGRGCLKSSDSVSSTCNSSHKIISTIYQVLFPAAMFHLTHLKGRHLLQYLGSPCWMWRFLWKLCGFCENFEARLLWHVLTQSSYSVNNN